METIIICTFIIILVFLSTMAYSGKARKSKIVYSYTAKQSLLTQAEKEFFVMLQQAVNERYHVFPQVHLSALLDHRVPGQNWDHAFRHINGKSVDYVLCDKSTLEPVYAIELDDYTHHYASRTRRDQEVERIFTGANIPLVRFTDYKTLTSQDIIQKLSHVYTLSQPSETRT